MEVKVSHQTILVPLGEEDVGPNERHAGARSVEGGALLPAGCALLLLAAVSERQGSHCGHRPELRGGLPQEEQLLDTQHVP